MSPTIRERIELARQKDYVSIQDLSLLSGVHARTIRRRLKAGLFPHVLRSGPRLIRIHRASAMRALRDCSLDQNRRNC